MMQAKVLEGRTAKLITLRYDGTCETCRRRIRKGKEAWYYPPESNPTFTLAGEIECVDCKKQLQLFGDDGESR